MAKRREARKNGRTKLGMELVEARRLMAADVAPSIDAVDATPTEGLESDQVLIAQHETTQSISNGFLPQQFGLPELRGNLDVWEHALANNEVILGIGPSGLDGVDEYFAELGQEGQERASSIPDEYSGVLRWSNLMEYYQVLDQLEGMIRDFDLSSANEFDFESSTSSSDDSKASLKERIGEALQEMKERMVVYWQNVDGPGHVVHDPFGVTNDGR